MTADLFADAFDTSLPGPAFSNGHEGETWQAAWCGGCAHSYTDADGCVLTDVALLGRIPAAWSALHQTSAGNRWACFSWEPAGADGDLGTMLCAALGRL